MRINAHLLPFALLAAAGCTTETISGDRSLLLADTDHLPSDPGISVGGSVPAWAGTLHIKFNGRYVVSGNERYGFSYLPIWGGDHSMAAFQADPGTSTAEIELLDEGGRTLLHTNPLPLPTRSDGLFLWVHDSPAGLVGEVPDTVVDDDPETAEIRAINVSPSDHVELYRCLGATNCPTCYTTHAGGGSFSPDECTLLTTVDPGQTWSSKVPVTHVSLGPGAACLGIHLQGQQMIGPMCAVELNTGPVGFHDLNYLFIDGLSPTLYSNADDPTVRLPGFFPYGVSR